MDLLATLNEVLDSTRLAVKMSEQALANLKPTTMTSVMMAQANVDWFKRHEYALERAIEIVKNESENTNEVEATLNLFMEMMDRVRDMWLKAHPDKKLMWPDGAGSIVWVLEQNERLREALRDRQMRWSEEHDERVRLEERVKRLEGEVEHWKSVANSEVTEG